jgi:uncharacterized protein YjbI with pentapeptide repeats
MPNVQDRELVRSVAANPIYLIVRGRRRHIPDPETFRYLQYQPNDVRELAQAEIDSLPIATPLPSYVEREEKQAAVSRRGSQLPGLSPERPNRVWLASVVLLTCFIIGAIIFVPNAVHYSPKLSANERQTAVANLRSAMIQIFAAIGGLGGVYFTVQSIVLNRQSIGATTYAQVAERYSKSLELIDVDNRVSKRLGGLLALARIGRISAGDRDTIARYLALLVRIDAIATGNDKRTSDEISTILNALADLRIDGFEDIYDLRQCRMSKLDGAPLRLGSTNLNGSTLSAFPALHSEISNSTFVRLSATDIDLRYSDLSKLLARNASLVRSDLSWCDLNGAVFLNANLVGLSLVGSELRNAVFIGADLSLANLRRTDLSKCDLSDCTLTGAFYDDLTQWPVDFDVAGSGVRKV